MTYKERWIKEHPNMDFDTDAGRCPRGILLCPDDLSCKACWEQEILTYEHKGEPIAKVLDVTIHEKDCGYLLSADLAKAGSAAKKAGEAFNKMAATIKDSGNRTEFKTGAVRDMREGKGRCDLMPLRVIARCYMGDVPSGEGDEEGERDCRVLNYIADFQETCDTKYLGKALDWFRGYDDWCTMFLEVSKHFEEGAKKYGENNWQKGIPVHCYIDSAVRHYLKWLRGDTDEPHDRAFVWNIMCCIWEVDYREKNKEE